MVFCSNLQRVRPGAPGTMLANICCVRRQPRCRVGTDFAVAESPVHLGVSENEGYPGTPIAGYSCMVCDGKSYWNDRFRGTPILGKPPRECFSHPKSEIKKDKSASWKGTSIEAGIPIVDVSGYAVCVAPLSTQDRQFSTCSTTPAIPNTDVGQERLRMMRVGRMHWIIRDDWL